MFIFSWVIDHTSIILAVVAVIIVLFIILLVVEDMRKRKAYEKWLAESQATEERIRADAKKTADLEAARQAREAYARNKPSRRIEIKVGLKRNQFQVFERTLANPTDKFLRGFGCHEAAEEYMLLLPRDKPAPTPQHLFTKGQKRLQKGEKHPNYVL